MAALAVLREEVPEKRSDAKGLLYVFPCLAVADKIFAVAGGDQVVRWQYDLCPSPHPYWRRPAGWCAHDLCQTWAPRVGRRAWRQVQFTLVVPANTSLVSWSVVLQERLRQSETSVGWKGLPGGELPAVGEFGIPK
ncbi:hypothetical protein L2E82_17977 [Cichorium intybus]|uniref:Uncharacterized protein n=1 Tax=Cichorium intybus TaxID=13427 RepID=A0ACB9F9M1_CICIN|nr:hypothetical protein L2E82_17977 [Cichorium intybus]